MMTATKRSNLSSDVTVVKGEKQPMFTERTKISMAGLCGWLSAGAEDQISHCNLTWTVNETEFFIPLPS